MGYSVGIGLTNACNLSCAHCYRDVVDVRYIGLDQVKRICETIPVDSMGMGTGENVLNPDFVPIVRYLNRRGVKLSIASNGHTLTVIPDDVLQAFQDVEVSIDYPTETEQNAFRGEGNWTLVHKAIERCHTLGVEVSILATLMSVNYGKMDAMVELARGNGVNLRVNAYQAVKTVDYRLSYHEFWEGYIRLFSVGKVISCSEPVVRAAMGLKGVRSPCGRQSIRFNPHGQIIPCVYWPVDGEQVPNIDDLVELGERVVEADIFRAARLVPPVAENCLCQGGCASRRALNRVVNAHDDYCPWVRGDQISLEWREAPEKTLMRGNNVCTTIVV